MRDEAKAGGGGGNVGSVGSWGDEGACGVGAEPQKFLLAGETTREGGRPMDGMTISSGSF